MSAASTARPLAAPAHRRARPATGRPSSRRPSRRYSGPARGVASGAAAVAAPGIALPARRPPAPRQAPRTRGQRSLAIPALPSASLLSPRRLFALSLRGRVWIAVLAVGLIGLITAQLVVLRLNTSIGQSLARISTLSRSNAAMAIANSEAGSGERVEEQARQLGMVALSPGELIFRRAAGRDGAQAAAQALRSTKATPLAGGAFSGADASTGAGASTAVSTEEAAASQTSPSGQQAAAAGSEGLPSTASTAGGEAGGGAGSQAGGGAGSQAGGGAIEQTPAAPTTQTFQSPPTQESQAGAAQAPTGTGG